MTEKPKTTYWVMLRDRSGKLVDCQWSIQTHNKDEAEHELRNQGAENLSRYKLIHERAKA